MPKTLVRGFTLLEVMVATMIVGVSLVAACGLFGQVVRTSSITERYARATMLAESKLDELLLQTLECGERNGKFSDEPIYAWQLKVAPSEISGVKQVTLTVRFSAPGGIRDVTLTTLQAERTLTARSGESID